MKSAIGPVELFGTAEPLPARRKLVAGPLSAIFEDGNLRDIRLGDVELVRAINYLARDEAWGTFRPTLSNLRIMENETTFTVDYDGVCGSPEAGFRYNMRIRGEASGTLTVEAEGTALADFPTNRTGFVVLHAADLAGGRMDLLHTDGSREAGLFPRLIMADQPAFDIAAITHQPAPGLTCTVEMFGDAFEMEDQRNWADASFKTYSRPLSKPRPYVIAKGGQDRQRIVVRAEGSTSSGGAAEAITAALSLGAPAAPAPRIALFVDEAGCGNLPIQAVPGLLILRLDLTAPDVPALRSIAARFAGSTEIAVELVMPAIDPDSEAATAMALICAASLRPVVLLVSPRREFKSRPSNTLPPGEATTDALVIALRAAGFSGPIGAGTPSYFTEFNRNPPGQEADFVFFSVAGIVHAADDLSLAQTIDVYPMLIESARALCFDKPVWPGPCTIGVRHNPYGAATQPNPENGRVPSATIDPRQRGLFGAAYAAASAAQAVLTGVAAVSLGAPTGPFGMIDGDGTARSIQAVVAELARVEGRISRPILGGPAGFHAFAYEEGAGAGGLLANLSPRDLDLVLPPEFSQAALLQPDGRWEPVALAAGRLSLPAWRTALLVA